MASGKKSYFRHSSNARKDDKIMDLIVNHGKEAYFHFFVLLELCATQASGEFPDDEKFTFHRRTLCDEWMVTNSRLSHHLLAIGSSLGLHWVMTENKVEILVPNLRKYMGKYDSKLPSNVPNKEIKEIKEINVVLDKPKTDSMKKEPKQEFDIEALYKLYPLKKGKKKGIEKFTKIIKNIEIYANVCQAIDNYSSECEGKDVGYIKHFSTFSNCWEDYLDENMETTTKGKYDNLNASELFEKLLEEEKEEMNSNV